MWSDSPKRYADVRIIFTDYETSNWTWDPLAKAYYWHRFFSHQPDLNFDNPEVQKAMLAVVDFWLELGVDGLRLDAVPYLFEREGTSCENLPETHDFLKKLRGWVDQHHPGRMLLAEANQWPEDAVAYFGAGDECHMAFHFPIMPRLYMALRMEDCFPIVEIMEQTPSIPKGCQWALFLRNHDELTLEMVTDEERDYMVRAYAQEPEMRINLGIRRRLAPLLNNNRRRIELMNALLFSLPGTPVIYYGDEIGMGDNVYLGDRDGVRTPMQWSPDRNAGFSKSNPQRLILPPVVDPEYHYEALNVETQQQNPSSLLWWMKRMIAMRKQYPAFGRGSYEPLSTENRKVLAFLRRHEGAVLLVLANLSRFAQCVDLDLAEFRGMVPIEVFGNAAFPVIGEGRYRLTLGPHYFFWFSLEPISGPDSVAPAATPVQLEVADSWHSVLQGRGRARPPVERALTQHLVSKRWFRGKARQLKAVRLRDALPLQRSGPGPQLLVVEATYADGEPETYTLAVDFAEFGSDNVIADLVVRSKRGDQFGKLLDVSEDPAFAEKLLTLVSMSKRVRGQRSELAAVADRSLKALAAEPPEARPLGVEQSNTTFVFGDEIACKFVRKLDEGASVEVEVLEHLKTRAEVAHVPRLLGRLALTQKGGADSTVVLFQRFVPNQGDAWSFTVDELERYFERIVTGPPELSLPATPAVQPLQLVGQAPPAGLAQCLGAYPDMARLLGKRTAELQLALADAPEDSPFHPESFTAMARRSYYQSVRNLTSRSFDLLRGQLAMLLPEQQRMARKLVGREREVQARLRRLLERPAAGKRIRGHGDYHLGQVLMTDSDFVIIDFEGEPARSAAERRRRRSPLSDVAGMLRSFHYAAFGVLTATPAGSDVRPEDVPALEPWAKSWTLWVSAAFLDGYLTALKGSGLVPEEEEDVASLLDVYLLEKCLYELGYELNNRPSWVGVPLLGLAHLLPPGDA